MKVIQPGLKWQVCCKLCEEFFTFSKGDKKPLNACKLGIYIILFAFLEDSSGCRVETRLEEGRNRCRRDNKQVLSFVQARDDISLGWSRQWGRERKGEAVIQGRSYEIWGKAGQRRVWRRKSPGLSTCFEMSFTEIGNQGSQRSSYQQTSSRRDDFRCCAQHGNTETQSKLQTPFSQRLC